MSQRSRRDPEGRGGVPAALLPSPTTKPRFLVRDRAPRSGQAAQYLNAYSWVWARSSADGGAGVPFLAAPEGSRALRRASRPWIGCVWNSRRRPRARRLDQARAEPRFPNPRPIRRCPARRHDGGGMTAEAASCRRNGRWAAPQTGRQRFRLPCRPWDGRHRRPRSAGLL
jgi:hypothetical protein